MGLHEGGAQLNGRSADRPSYTIGEPPKVGRRSRSSSGTGAAAASSSGRHGQDRPAGIATFIVPLHSVFALTTKTVALP